MLNVRGSRQHRFNWLVGDPGGDGRPRSLPVDAYYETLGLVVEYRELQHDRAVTFFDKPDRLTISGSTAASSDACATDGVTSSSLSTDSACGSSHRATSVATGEVA